MLDVLTRNSSVCLALAALVAACGLVKLGGSPNQTPPGPPAIQLVAGSFPGNSMNGQVVAGAAKVYDLQGNPSGSGSYLLRLEGLSITPGQAGLMAQLYGNGQLIYFVPLISSTGDQNYAFSAQSGISWNWVQIASSNGLKDYGIANLLP